MLVSKNLLSTLITNSGKIIPSRRILQEIRLVQIIHGIRQPFHVLMSKTGRSDIAGHVRRPGTEKTFEAGAYARVYLSALAQKLPESNYVESTGRSLRLNLAKDKLPEQQVEWHVPDIWNAFERNRARAYAVGFNLMVTIENWVRAQDLIKRGEKQVATPFEIPTSGQHIGAGFWGAGRGFLAHWCVIENGVLANYQISTPSTVNSCPRTPWGTPGAYEQSVLNTPIIETNFSDETDFKGIDILRALRSFDPCMPCTTHVMVEGTDRIVTREVTTCACGL